jgi:excisionase family DNA binding protein
MHAYQEDRWLSVDEIANYLGVKPDTVYKWLARTEIPGHKVGRLWKFKTEEVDRWVRAGGGSESPRKKQSTAKRRR